MSSLNEFSFTKNKVVEIDNEFKVYIAPLQNLKEGQVKKAVEGINSKEKALLKEFADAGNKIYISKYILSGEMESGRFRFAEDGNCWLDISILITGRIEAGIVVHEYTHWKQWLRGDLSFKVIDGKSIVFWKDQDMGELPSCANDYLKSPWEYEAHMAQYEWLYEQGFTKKTPKEQMTSRVREIALVSKLNSVEEWIDSEQFERVLYFVVPTLLILTGWGLVALWGSLGPINGFVDAFSWIIFLGGGALWTCWGSKLLSRAYRDLKSINRATT